MTSPEQPTSPNTLKKSFAKKGVATAAAGLITAGAIVAAQRGEGGNQEAQEPAEMPEGANEFVVEQPVEDITLDTVVEVETPTRTSSTVIENEHVSLETQPSEEIYEQIDNVIIHFDRYINEHIDELQFNGEETKFLAPTAENPLGLTVGYNDLVPSEVTLEFYNAEDINAGQFNLKQQLIVSRDLQGTSWEISKRGYEAGEYNPEISFSAQFNEDAGEIQTVGATDDTIESVQKIMQQIETLVGESGETNN